MNSRKFDWINISTFILVVSLSIFVGWFFTSKIIKIESKKENNQLEFAKDSLTLQDSVYSYIFELRLDHPEVVFAQVMLESNKLSSKLFRENHNLFGMKIAGNRPTTAIGVKNGYAYYKTWRESVIDYALYQAAYRRNLSKEEYYIKLGENYAEDSEYVQKLKSYK